VNLIMKILDCACGTYYILVSVLIILKDGLSTFTSASYL
jgi:hypothetical protein